MAVEVETRQVTMTCQIQRGAVARERVVALPMVGRYAMKEAVFAVRHRSYRENQSGDTMRHLVHVTRGTSTDTICGYKQ